MGWFIFEDKARVPMGIDSLATYRRWAKSDDYPDRGWFSYLAGVIYVDLSMEQAFSHNRVKTRFTAVLEPLIEDRQAGYFFSDRMLLSNPLADLSTEPDAMFVSYEAIASGKARLVEGSRDGFVEVEGAPDMVLEVVSDNSVKKDKVLLVELYWRAGIPEYWLVDARGSSPKFDIFKHRREGYVSTRRQKDGWLKSEVFGRSFRFAQLDADQLGHPRYDLAVR
jgi:Uma2 family endonuclease